MSALTMAVAVGLVAGRERIVRAAPSAARLYAAVRLPVNSLGLELKGVRSEFVVSGADKLLVVEGEILNVATMDVDVPTLELSVRGPNGLSLYTWTSEAPRTTLDTGCRREHPIQGAARVPARRRAGGFGPFRPGAGIGDRLRPGAVRLSVRFLA
jgi:hypothetical protein